jgi:hypothetical protein
MPEWTWWELAMFITKTVATLGAFATCFYACKLTNWWRGWVLITIGLGLAPFIGILQILNILGIPEPDYWMRWTGVVLPFASMMFVSVGAWEVVKHIRMILKYYKKGDNT